jgi:pimeloyl-ACP methyl ester carboxylesterase
MRWLCWLFPGLSFWGCTSLTPYEEVWRNLPENRRLELEGQRVHVEVAGEGPPLLLLHGFGGSSWSWREVIPELSRIRTVVALDLNGFGWTERPREPGSYSLVGQESLVLKVADRLGFEQFDLMGHSYGGAIAIFLAARHPERVRRLVLVDSARPSYAQERRRRIFALRTLARWYVKTVGVTKQVVRRGLQGAFYDDSKVTEDLVQGYLERLRVEGLEEAFFGLTAPQTVGRDPEVSFEQVQAKTLVLWGEEDRLISPAFGEKLASKLLEARFEKLPACGHNPMEECPDRFLKVAVPFLEEESGGSEVRSMGSGQ